MTDANHTTVPSIDESIRNVIKRHDETRSDREILRTKLRTMIQAIPDSNLSGKDLESATTLFNSFQSTLDGLDKQEQIVSKLLLSKKGTEDNADTGKAVVEFLKRKNTQKTNLDYVQGELDEAIDGIYSRNCQPIEDGELE